jgi:uncharacterized protein (DUF885 family)
MATVLSAMCLVTLLTADVSLGEERMDAAFKKIGEEYIEQFAKFSPVQATMLGDHRYDGKLDEVSGESRQERLVWIRDIKKQLANIDRDKLSRANQVDYALVMHELNSRQWKIESLQEWAWNPLVYTELTGTSIYNLMSREFAPLAERLGNVARRLEQFPRLLQQVRETLDVERIPEIHAKTAVSQNAGVLRILENMVRPQLGKLSEKDRQRLTKAIAVAELAIAKHQKWLETEMLPKAKGEFRLGMEQFDEKLAFTLHSPIKRQTIKAIGEKRVEQLHNQMYALAKPLYQKQYPLTRFPKVPSAEYKRAIIRFGLEQAYAEMPAADKIVATAEEQVVNATEFMKRKNIATVLPDPLEIIIMPEFQRGVSLAYCDSPGPLDVNQKTFYAVSPIPKKWTQTQINSFLREYNTRSLYVLTIHEALPGHFHQLAHANRYKGRLRHLFASGVFIEGWAVYSEWMMCQEGFLDHDPLMKLVTLKWYLRDVTNALLDQAIHVDGMSRENAMRMMVEDAFQEEREAAGKWVRAQLTSAQLSTYFIGYLEHVLLRKEAEEQLGDKFHLKTYHDKVLSFGSPPPQFARALVLDKPIPK